MEKVVLSVVVLCWLWCAADCTTIRLEVFAEFTAHTCDADHENARIEHLQAVRCGKPREVLVQIPSPAAHIQVIPRAVFVNRCVGLCNSARRECAPKAEVSTRVPVRHLDVSTGKEWCAYYPVVEHVECGCAKVT